MLKRLEDMILKNNSNRLCSIDDNRSYTYSEVKQRILHFSNFLSEYEFDAQSRIIVFMPNDTKAIVSIFAILNCNMIAVPIDIQTPSNVLIDMINAVDAQAIICLSKKSIEQIVFEKCSEIKIIIYDECFSKNTVKNEHLIKKREDDLALILFTSGTTGRFKAVVHSHKTVLSNIDSVLDYMKVDENDKFYVMKTYVHCSSLLSEILVALFVNASVCLYKPKVSISVTIERIMKENATVLGTNPTFLRLLTSLNSEKIVDKLVSIKIVATSGATVSKELLCKCKWLFKNGKIINVYGLTEAGPRVSAQRPDGFYKDGSVGHPIKNVSVKIENIRTYGKNDAGEVLVQTPSMMLRYWNDEKETNKKIVDNWLRTGDLGYFDQDGELYIIGRIDDMIIRSSHNVDPFRIDSIVETMEGIKQCVTFGVPDEINGQNIVSAVVKRESYIQAKDILDYCRKNLYGYELPNFIMFVDDIPLTTGKKVSRKELQEQYFKRYVSNTNFEKS